MYSNNQTIQKVVDKFEKLRNLVEKALPKQNPTSVKDKLKTLTIKNWTAKFPKAKTNSAFLFLTFF